MKKLISIVGQTSSGKSSLGIALAEFFDGEIVSADSRQVYVGLDWCSGKVTKEEMEQVKHHLIDVAELGNQFTLFDFQQAAYSAIDDIHKRGKVPFLVGGTGLYSRSIVEGYNLEPSKPDLELRNKLEGLSLDELRDMCYQKCIKTEDETTCRRLIRLLERDLTEKQENQPRYEVLQIGIKFDRAEIYERIRVRLEARMPFMIEEIKNLKKKGVSAEFLNSLGLEAKFVQRYLDGEFNSYEEFFEELFKEERHFAKRQQTWYNKEKNLVWLDANDNLVETAKKLVQEFLNK